MNRIGNRLISGAERQKASRAKAKARGVCLYCRVNPNNGKTICEQCSDLRKQERERRKASGLCSTLHCPHPPIEGLTCCTVCTERRKATMRVLKERVLNHYGARCNCSCGCSVTNPRHLTIDHINSDGGRQREAQKIHGGHANYRNIIKAGFPDDLQILCWNCNCAKEFSGGCL